MGEHTLQHHLLIKQNNFLTHHLQQNSSNPSSVTYEHGQDRFPFLIFNQRVLTLQSQQSNAIKPIQLSTMMRNVHLTYNDHRKIQFLLGLIATFRNDFL